MWAKAKDRIWKCWEVNHIFREANRCANNLARVGCSLVGNFVVLDLPPTDVLCNILSSDTTGMYSLRLFVITSPFMAS